MLDCRSRIAETDELGQGVRFSGRESGACRGCLRKRRFRHLARAPEALLLDEPTSGISAEEKFPLMDLVLNAARAADATVLFIEHDMEVVERYAERVIAFYDGRIIADDEPARVFVDADVRRFVVGTELHRRERSRA